jgi:HEAT repeat protein
MVDAFKGQYAEVMGELAFALGLIGEPAIPILLEALNNEDPDIRHGAVQSIGWSIWSSSPYAEQIFSSLLKVLDDKEEEVIIRGEAAFILSRVKLKPDILVPKLTAMLKESDCGIRWNGARNLSYYGSQAAPALSELLTIIENENCEGARSKAIEAIGRIGPAAKSAVPKLLERINSADQVIILLALSEIGPEPGVLEAFLELLREGDKSARNAAAGNIHKLGSGSAIVQALIRALEDESQYVRDSAIESLGSLGGAAKDALPALKELLENIEGDNLDLVEKNRRFLLKGSIRDIEEDMEK